MRIIDDIIIHPMHVTTRCIDRHCEGSYRQEGDHFIFEMEQTKRWFNQDSFPPRVGYLLIPEGSNKTYEITKVDFLEKRPKKAVFTAVPFTPDKFHPSSSAAIL